MAGALGGTVARSPDPEIGWCEVQSSNPSLVFRDKVRYFQEAPPAADWDGVHVAKEK